MKPNTSSDTAIAYLSIGIIFLIAGVFIAWMLLRSPEEPLSDGAFVSVGPLSFPIKGYTVRASLAIQSSKDDAGWVADNKSSLQSLLQQTLESTEPALMTSPGEAKFTNLQTALTKAVGTRFPQAGAMRILITDFISAEN